MVDLGLVPGFDPTGKKEVWRTDHLHRPVFKGPARAPGALGIGTSTTGLAGLRPAFRNHHWPGLDVEPLRQSRFDSAIGKIARSKGPPTRCLRSDLWELAQVLHDRLNLAQVAQDVVLVEYRARQRECVWSNALGSLLPELAPAIP